MTEELIKQKAEEYYDKTIYKPCKEKGWVDDYGDPYLNEEDVKEAYIAGATENGIQWHDLRKDPNDLPPVAKKVWIQCEGEVEGDTWLYFKDFPKKTIA